MILGRTMHHDGHEAGGGSPMKHYDTKDLLVREDIMAQAKKLADLLHTSSEAETFRKAEKQIQNHQEVQQLIATIKKKQKEIVAFETTFKNEAMVKKIEKEIEELQNQLDEFPIVAQFRQSQADLNYMLQLVFDIIQETLSKKIELDSSKETITHGGSCG